MAALNRSPPGPVGQEIRLLLVCLQIQFFRFVKVAAEKVQVAQSIDCVGVSGPQLPVTAQSGEAGLGIAGEGGGVTKLIEQVGVLGIVVHRTAVGIFGLLVVVPVIGHFGEKLPRPRIRPIRA